MKRKYHEHYDKGVAAGVYKCACTADYTGGDCEHEINECASNPCSNGATVRY